jgi:23S rRNA (pseudouridine1915-N3)-methyltransferase
VPSWTRPSRATAGSPRLADLRLLAVGRIGRGPEAELVARYAARLRPPLAMTEIADGRGSPAEIKRREAASLLAALPDAALAIALDLGGTAPDSTEFAAKLESWLGAGRPVCFLIGGAEGLDASVLARADHTLSLGRLTWPHLLARVMLAEQLYRARAITAGHPYHRAGRP